MSDDINVSNLRVLLADDSKAMRTILKSHLKSQKITKLVEVENGSMVIPRLQKENFDLVLCDWNMPEMTGIEVITEIRKMENFKSLPFIMITTEGDKEHIVAAAEAGVSDYIVKPFSPETLLQKIKRVIR